MSAFDFSTGARQVFNMVDVAKKARQKTAEVVHVAVYVDASAPREVVGWVRDALVPERDSALVDVELVPETGIVRVHSGSTLAIVVAGGDSAVLRDLVAGFAEDGLPVAVVAVRELDAPDLEGRIPEDAQVALIAATSEDALRSKLASWIVTVLPEDLTLASNFEFVRRAKADQLISTCATENVLVGAVAIGSGAQMPIMTANQARLALNLSSIYGTDVLAQQVPAVLGVAAGGYAYRGISRLALKALPNLGPLVRAAIAFGGTVLTGKVLGFWMDRMRAEWGEPGEA